MIYFICACTYRWVNKGEAGDLRCHHTHYDVIVMLSRGLTMFISVFALIYHNMRMTVYLGSYKLYSLQWYLENPWRYLHEGTKSLCFEVSSSHSVCHLNTQQLTIHSSAYFVLDECHYQLAVQGDQTAAMQYCSEHHVWSGGNCYDDTGEIDEIIQRTVLSSNYPRESGHR